MKNQSSKYRNGIYQATSVDNVWNSATYHLAQKDLTEKELRVKLSNKTECQEWIDNVVARCLDYGFLKSNRDFAINFAENSLSAQRGAGFVRTKLRGKGITDQDIENSIQQIYIDRAIDEKDLIRSRLFNTDFSSISREKLINDLSKKGFSNSDIRIVITEVDDKKALKSKAEIKGLKADIRNEILKLYRKGKGKRAISQQLKINKIPMDNFDSTIDELEKSETVDFYELAVEVLSKKRLDMHDSKDKSKAYTYLGSRGFDSEQIKYAINELSER